MDSRHISVLLRETVDGLGLRAGDDAVDCTSGAGGHGEAILEKTSPGGRLLALDLDDAALAASRATLARFGGRAVVTKSSYLDAPRVAKEQGFGKVKGIVLDLGFSSLEIDDPSRGFSFRADGPLDMRYDVAQDVSAATVVNGWSEKELADLIWMYGDERYARVIAAAIVKRRREKRIMGTLDLVDVIAGAVPAAYRQGGAHFATRTFQALRIAVNDELGTLEAALPGLIGMLAEGGRIAVISFHSLEDRIVKNAFREADDLVPLTKRPVEPTAEECIANPRARSAKLRIAAKVDID
jgi:16S rRNA (cytosine1402-N4)-methyltransferase